jgi:acyl-CoA synthetase (AMP-forming)/AMP-acid ligase II
MSSVLIHEQRVQALDRCAILAHNSEKYLAVSLGLMRSRAISVNLNWRSPVVNLTELVRKSECRFLFATAAFAATAQEIAAAVTSVEVVYFDSLLDLHDLGPCRDVDETSEVACGLSDTAAVFFTSGSTSLPKAVPHTHATLMWLAESYYQAFPEPYSNANPDAATLCFFPYFHVMVYNHKILCVSETDLPLSVSGLLSQFHLQPILWDQDLYSCRSVELLIFVFSIFIVEWKQMQSMLLSRLKCCCVRAMTCGRQFSTHHRGW